MKLYLLFLLVAYTRSHSKYNFMYLRIDLLVVGPTWNDSSVKEFIFSMHGKVFY